MKTTQTIPFDLETALKEPERVVFEDGEKVVQWYYFNESKSMYPIMCVRKNGSIISCDVKGFHTVSETNPCNLRLTAKVTQLWSIVVIDFNGKLAILGGNYSKGSEAIDAAKRLGFKEIIGEPFNIEIKV